MRSTRATQATGGRSSSPSMSPATRRSTPRESRPSATPCSGSSEADRATWTSSSSTRPATPGPPVPRHRQCPPRPEEGSAGRPGAVAEGGGHGEHQALHRRGRGRRSGRWSGRGVRAARGGPQGPASRAPDWPTTPPAATPSPRGPSPGRAGPAVGVRPSERSSYSGRRSTTVTRTTITSRRTPTSTRSAACRPSAS